MFMQEVKYRFSQVKNDRLYEFLIVPGTSWDDIYAVLDDFKEEFKKLHEEALKKEAEAAAQKPLEEVQAEVVSPQGE